MASQALDVEDFRRLARARLPKGIVDYIDRGAEEKVNALGDGFDRTTFSPRILVDVSERDLSVELLGHRQPLPLVALGARAVMVGRSVLYRTAAGSQAGARRVLDLLRKEIDTHPALLGRPSLPVLDAGFVNCKP
jgi:isopentenyl diphosphate isomerase/L-lactate dehydrogenase-like FMN-dependent dehydrogenase